jgi:sulfate adenylyltransferase subunit 2
MSNLFIPNPKEAESIHILREVAAQFERPVLLFLEEKIRLPWSDWLKRHFFQLKFLFRYCMWIQGIIFRRP